jgi:hypothetical protein
MRRRKKRTTKELRFTLRDGDRLELCVPHGRGRKRASVRIPRECLMRILKLPVDARRARRA